MPVPFTLFSGYNYFYSPNLLGLWTAIQSPPVTRHTHTSTHLSKIMMVLCTWWYFQLVTTVNRLFGRRFFVFASRSKCPRYFPPLHTTRSSFCTTIGEILMWTWKQKQMLHFMDLQIQNGIHKKVGFVFRGERDNVSKVLCRVSLVWF